MPAMQRLRRSKDALSVVERYWSVENPNETVCKIPRACLRRDGKIIVDQRLQNITKQCHLRNVEFMDTISMDKSITSSTSQLTLVGSYEMQRHIPHFLGDVLPAIFAVEIIWSKFPHHSKRVVCSTPSEPNLNCDTGALQSIENEQLTIRVHDSVLKFKNTHWIPSLISMLQGSPSMFSSQSLFSDNENYSFSCFSSIITFGNSRFRLQNKEWFGDKNSFFWENKLVRSGLTRFEEIRKMEMETVKKQRCKIRAVIVDRLPSSKRHITNLVELVNLIQSLKEHENDDRYSLDIETVYFEKMTFTEQVISMETANLIIGTHGAGLSNIIFAKMGTPLIEIHPFMYYAGPFYAVAEAFSLNYTSIVAYPDTMAYMDCLRLFRKQQKINSTFVEAAIKIWENGLETLRLYGNETIGIPHWALPEGFYLRYCVREQQLLVNLTQIINYIAEGIKYAKERHCKI